MSECRTGLRLNVVPELPKSKILLPNTITVAPALRVIRTKAGLGHDSGCNCFSGLAAGSMTTSCSLPSTPVSATRTAFCIDQQAGRRRSKSSDRDGKADTKEEAHGSRGRRQWAPTSGFSWTPSGGWSVAPREEVQGRDLVEMFSKKEQRARKRFQTRMRKRACRPTGGAPGRDGMRRRKRRRRRTVVFPERACPSPPARPRPACAWRVP